MKTIIHQYRFDISNSDEKEQYKALRKKLVSMGLECFETWGGGSHYNPKLVGEIELDTSFIFSNQWTTQPTLRSEKGFRLHDWAQDYPINFSKKIKRGHWLEQTAEMKNIRDNTLVCGYCGKYEPITSEKIFCEKCLDSEYLERKDLHLLRFFPVALHNPKRAELTEAELSELLPQYKEAQLHGNTERGKKRIAEKRASIEKEYQQTTTNAKTELDGLLWLMDNGINTDNCIFYNHKNIFSFGWRNPTDESIKDELVELLKNFPFAYEIK